MRHAQILHQMNILTNQWTVSYLMKILLLLPEKQGLESTMAATSRKEVDQRTSQSQYTGCPIH